MTIDIQQLEKSLAEKDFDSVQKQISEVVSGKITTKEQGSAFVSLAEMYLDIINNINLEYKAVLEEAIKGMNVVNKAQSKMKDNIRVRELKAGLNK